MGLGQSLLVALLRIGVRLSGALRAFVAQGRVEHWLAEWFDLLLERALIRPDQFIKLNRVLFLNWHLLGQ